MMKLQKIFFLILVGLVFTSLNQVKADELIIPEFKLVRNQNGDLTDIFTVLGLKGDSYIAITDNLEVEAESEFLLLGVTTVVQNRIFLVEVFEYYHEYYDENNSFKVNSSLIEPRKEVVIETTNFDESIIVGDYDEFVWVKISLDGIGFLFQFKTVWEYQLVTKTNIEWFSEKIIDNWVFIFIIAIVCIVLSIAIVERRPFPSPNEKQVLPVVWFVFGLLFILLSLVLKPPNMLIFTIGFFIILSEFTVYPLSALLRKNMKFLLFDDLLTETNVLIYVMEKGRDIVYIDYLSYLDLFLGLFKKHRVLNVEEYLRKQKGKLHYKVYAENVELPDYKLKTTDSNYLRFGLIILSSIIFVLAVVLDFPILLGLIPLILVGYGLAFVSIENKQFKADFYPKTAVKLFADSLAEKMKEQEVKLLALIKQLEQSIEKANKVDYKQLTTDYKTKLKAIRGGIITDLKKTSLEIVSSIKILKGIIENPDELIKELKVLNKAAERIEKLMASNSDLRRRVLVGEGLEEIKDILMLEKKIYPKNFEKIFAKEVPKLDEAIKKNKYKSSESLEEDPKEKAVGKKEDEGGSVA